MPRWALIRHPIHIGHVPCLAFVSLQYVPMGMSVHTSTTSHWCLERRGSRGVGGGGDATMAASCESYPTVSRGVEGLES